MTRIDRSLRVAGTRGPRPGLVGRRLEPPWPAAAPAQQATMVVILAWPSKPAPASKTSAGRTQSVSGRSGASPAGPLQKTSESATRRRPGPGTPGGCRRAPTSRVCRVVGRSIKNRVVHSVKAPSRTTNSIRGRAREFDTCLHHHRSVLLCASFGPLSGMPGGPFLDEYIWRWYQQCSSREA